MKTLIFALTLISVLAHAEPSKECANIAAIADITKKAIIEDGSMFAVRVADIQGDKPLHPVTNLVSFDIDGEVVKITIANPDRFSAVRKSCARADIIDSYSVAACKLGAIIPTLERFHVDRTSANAAGDLIREARVGVDNAQPNADVMGKGVSNLNKTVSLNLIKIWNEVIGNALDLHKKDILKDDVTPLKTSLEKMVSTWTGAPIDCTPKK